MKKIFSFSIFTAFLLSLPTVTRAAEDPARYSPVYFNSAVRLAAKGETRLAVEQYVKSLIADPANRDARDALKILCLKGQWDGESRREIIQFLDLIDQVGLLMTQISRAREEIEDSAAFIKARGGEDHIPSIRFALDNSSVNLSDSLPFLLIKDENIFNGPFSIPRINRLVKGVKDDLLGQLDRLQGLGRNLRQVKKELLARLPTAQPAPPITDMKEQLKDVMLKMAMKDEVISRQEKNIEKLRDELITVKTDFEQVRARMAQNEQRVVDLTRELVDMTLNAQETQTTARDREGYSAELQSDLRETEERLALAQRLIQEKDRKIEDLAAKMSRLEEQAGKSEALRSQGMEVLRQEFTDLQTELQAKSRDSLDKIAEMELRLSAVQEKYKALEDVVLSKEGEVRSLQAEVLFRDEKISKLKQIFDSKDRKLIELMGILDIYKEKLKESKGLLEAKDLKIKDLDNQLDEIDRRLQEVDISPASGPTGPSGPDDAISFILNGGVTTGRPAPAFLRGN